MRRRRHLPGWHHVEVCPRTLPQPDLAPGDLSLSSASSPVTGGQPDPSAPPADGAAPESPRLPGPPFPGGGGTNVQGP